MKSSGNQNRSRVRNLVSVSSIVTALIFAAFGLALLIAPDTSSRMFAMALAALMALVGVYYIVIYFFGEKAAVFTRNDLTLGLTLLTGGIILFAMPEIPGGVLPYIWGGALVVGGFAKLQTAIDMHRLSAAGWWHFLIGAGIVMALGAVALCNPFDTEIILLRFLGGGMLAEGLMDGYCWYLVSRLRRAMK